MKEILLKKSKYGFQLTDGEYSEFCKFTNVNNKFTFSNSDNFTRTLFTTKKWREHCSGTLKLEDFETQILVKGNKSLVFNIVEDECTFGYRSGRIVYSTELIGSHQVKIVVEEIHDWDE